MRKNPGSRPKKRACVPSRDVQRKKSAAGEKHGNKIRVEKIAGESWLARQVCSNDPDGSCKTSGKSSIFKRDCRGFELATRQLSTVVSGMKLSVSPKYVYAERDDRTVCMMLDEFTSGVCCQSPRETDCMEQRSAERAESQLQRRFSETSSERARRIDRRRHRRRDCRQLDYSCASSGRGSESKLDLAGG